ncbi:unnamed protein product [Linum tenue]|uniref:Uncharacterized protein n=1 Tax=Linum tenue TaxID=586396 RepID=A0AAV0P4M3_9ROSI|nr:unnamed protein product [Linum tenue]
MMVAWGDVAKICMKHVNPTGDFISVSELLGSYSKSDDKEGYDQQSQEPTWNFGKIISRNSFSSTKRGNCSSYSIHKRQSKIREMLHKELTSLKVGPRMPSICGKSSILNTSGYR